MEPAIKNEIKEIAWPGKTFITKRATIPFDKLTDFFGENYGAIYSILYKAGLQPAAPPCAIYYSVDEVKKETDLAAAVPAPASITAMEGFDVINIPQSKAIAATHYGSYDSMAETYGLIGKYMAEHGLKQKWMIEEYLSDPAIEKDPANWKTNIYFVL